MRFKFCSVAILFTISIFLFTILIFVLSVFHLPKTIAQTISVSPVADIETKNSTPYSVQVTATVPYFWWLELTGWASPYAQVELTMGQIVKRLTNANPEGKFTFRLALPHLSAPVCLIATDVSNISSSPLCLPPPPLGVDILIKEVVMPPTLKIDKGKIAQGETVAAQGYTTPNSEVIPYLFAEKPPKNFSVFNFQFLVPRVFATEIPKPHVKSNQNGFYQFNLPTSDTGKNRIFVGSIFLNNPSPKSTTLVFNIFSWWRMLLEKIAVFLTNLLWWVLKFLKTPEGVIIVEVFLIVFIFFLFRKTSNPKSKTQKENRYKFCRSQIN